MSLPLRITFEGKDYTYVILSRLISRDSREIRIRLEEQELTLFRNESGDWDALERTISDKPGLLKAIARSVALRYGLR